MTDPLDMRLDEEVPEQRDGSEDENEYREELRKRRLISAILTVVLVLLLIALFVGRVPSTIGLGRRAAVRQVALAGFESEVTTVAAGARPAGRIAAQWPKSRLFFKFWPVQLFVTGGIGVDVDGSPGRPGGAVPPVAGKAKVREIMPDDPEEVDPLYVPLVGLRPVMPNVQNMSESQARRAIRRVGLSTRSRFGPSTVSVKKNRVYYQSPTPGSLISPGERAVIWVSTGDYNTLEPPALRYQENRP